jgi:hypothetical protein
LRQSEQSVPDEQYCGSSHSANKWDVQHYTWSDYKFLSIDCFRYLYRVCAHPGHVHGCRRTTIVSISARVAVCIYATTAAAAARATKKTRARATVCRAASILAGSSASVAPAAVLIAVSGCALAATFVPRTTCVDLDAACKQCQCAHVEILLHDRYDVEGG